MQCLLQMHALPGSQVCRPAEQRLLLGCCCCSAPWWDGSPAGSNRAGRGPAQPRACKAMFTTQHLAPDAIVSTHPDRRLGRRSMLKCSLVVPLLELCCGAVQDRPPQQSDDSVRCAMLGLHEALKSPSFQGTSRLLRSDLSDEQVQMKLSSCLHQAHQRGWKRCVPLGAWCRRSMRQAPEHGLTIQHSADGCCGCCTWSGYV